MSCRWNEFAQSQNNAMPRIQYKYSALAVLLIVNSVDGHGAVVNPPPRNAVDKDLAPWNGPVPCHLTGKCPSVETDTGW